MEASPRVLTVEVLAFIVMSFLRTCPIGLGEGSCSSCVFASDFFSVPFDLNRTVLTYPVKAFCATANVILVLGSLYDLRTYTFG